MNEPQSCRKPKEDSEPRIMSNPRKSSEPAEYSKPKKCSEPRTERKPNGDSELCNSRNPSKKSGFNREAVRQLVEIYYDTQEVRIRSFNRLRQIGEVKGVHPEALKSLEKEIKNYITEEIKDVPVCAQFLQPIKGIGPILAGGLLAWLDPYKADHISSFWKYCGLHVAEGTAIKREKGKKLGFPLKLRTLCWKIGKSFVRAKTPFYRDIYDKAKVSENRKLGNPIENPQNCPMYKKCLIRLGQKAKRLSVKPKNPPCKQHIDYRAMRKMVKRFLADFWLAWRRLEGLPLSEPYAVAILHHSKEK